MIIKNKQLLLTATWTATATPVMATLTRTMITGQWDLTAPQFIAMIIYTTIMLATSIYTTKKNGGF